MSLASLPAGRPADAERRERILEGAEHAFVRHGFHAATMQHVADELGMSAGNLYRYFPSKEAIVEGLCAVDQASRARAFAELMADKGDVMEAMCAALRHHCLDKPQEKARLIVEIWAEAGRNPRVGALSRQIDADVLAGLEKLMDAAKAAGVASPRLDSRFGARFFFTFVAGLFKRIAVEPDFDPEAEAPVAIGVLKALFAGKLSSDPATPGEEGRR
jgi:TetR/AcrR family transcriptional regulator, repressor for uid operon